MRLQGGTDLRDTKGQPSLSWTNLRLQGNTVFKGHLTLSWTYMRLQGGSDLRDTLHYRGLTCVNKVVQT